MPSLPTKKRLLKSCLAHARSSLADHPERNNFIHFSYIVDCKGKLLGWGWNHNQTPPKHYGYHTRHEFPKMHSEIMAYRRARKRWRLGRMEWGIINIRLNRKGEVKNSTPCICCVQLLGALGCRFLYSVGEMKCCKSLSYSRRQRKLLSC